MIFDVGANIASEIVLLSDLGGPTGAVDAVAPLPPNAGLLRQKTGEPAAIVDATCEGGSIPRDGDWRAVSRPGVALIDVIPGPPRSPG